jgi:3-hydroxy-9,10-secoandrosta-1,3,5(10)-triene-9,17-dione monooxygenase reductase component
MGFDVARFKEVMSRFASGVTIVSGMEGDEPVGFTCQAFISLSVEPPFVALAPARTSTSWPRIAQAGSFCVNILSDQQSETASGFAVSGGPKFEGVNWRPAPITGAPVLEGSLAWVDCHVELVHDAGDHELIIGKVLELGTGEGSPLIYYESRFGALARADALSREGPSA